MAIEKGATNNQDVDLDDLEVVILIIAKNPAKIGQAANFLSRRGWPTTAMNNLSQAIEFATDRKPDLVLISVNHANPAISKFSDLLTTTFGTTCVAFAENMDTASTVRLQKSLLPLKVQGQASGPNLHRSLRKILAEKLNIQLDEKGQPERQQAGDKNVTVKGNSNDGQTIVQKNDHGVSHNKGPTTIKGEVSQANESKYENEAVSSGKYTMTKKNRRSLRDISQNPLDKSGDVVMGESKEIAAKLKKSLFGDLMDNQAAQTAQPEEPEEIVNGDSLVYPEHENETSENINENDESTEAGNSVTSRRAAGGNGKGSTSHLQAGHEGPVTQKATPAKQRQSSAVQTAPESVGTSALTKDPSNSPVHGGAIGHPGYRPGTGPNGSAQQETAAANSFSVKPAVNENSNDSDVFELKKSLASVGPHSLIERAVQDALREIAQPAKAGGHDPIALIEQVGVFPIDSPTLPGYLVLAWPHEEMRAIEPFFKQAQNMIASTFKKMGVQASLEAGFFVSLPQVDFATWASDAASFFFSTAHGNEEIGVAFFATQQPIPKPKQIEDKTMYSIGLENISTEQPVNFKVYLHMKKNKKYFLYLRNGRRLQPEQKQRLEGNKVKDLYMKTIDVENLRMFLASCHLRKKIKKAA